MKLHEILSIIDGTVLLDEQVPMLDLDIPGCFGADLMSDVLTSTQPRSLLLTGLCNPQVIRTAQMADIPAIILVRGKIPHPDTLELANQENIILLSSPYGMFEVCGRLYQAGLPSLEI